MKKILLSMTLFALVGYANAKAPNGRSPQAACDLSLSNLTLTSNSLTGTGPYTLNYNLSFYIDNNGGNKQIYINLWNSSQYVTGAGEYNWTASNSDMPKLSEMDGAGGGNGPLAIIGLRLTGSSTTPSATFVPYYSGDNANINYLGRLDSGTSVTATYISDVNDPQFGRTYFVINGLTMTQANPSFDIKGNIWGSQTQIGNIGATPLIHCYDDLFDFVLGDVTIDAATQMNCSVGITPRTVDVFLNTTAACPTGIAVSYSFVVDMDNDGVIDGSEPTTPATAFTPTICDVNPAPSTAPDYSNTSINYGSPYSTDAQYAGKRLILVVTYVVAGTTIELVQPIANPCTILPVGFKSIAASRSRSNVLVSWETSFEQNNRGFYVQRKTNGDWQNVAFVFTAANGGNSTTELSYNFTDANNYNGVSQYRILQVDLDGRSKFSDIRSIRGLEQLSKVIVYPNPSNTGKINILFEAKTGSRNVTISDISGRMVKQFRNITADNLAVELNQSGVYSIQITDLSTSATTVEKVIIKKR